MPERLKVVCKSCKALYKCSALPFTFTITGVHLVRLMYAEQHQVTADPQTNQSINQFILRHSREACATVRLCRIKEKCLKPLLGEHEWFTLTISEISCTPRAMAFLTMGVMSPLSVATATEISMFSRRCGVSPDHTTFTSGTLYTHSRSIFCIRQVTLTSANKVRLYLAFVFVC